MELSLSLATINWNRYTETPKELIQRLQKNHLLHITGYTRNSSVFERKDISLCGKDSNIAYGEVNQLTINNDVLNHFTYRWDGKCTHGCICRSAII